MFANRILTQAGTRLYEAIVMQARQPVFYQRDGVADDVDGRWDIIVLHACLVFLRLSGGDRKHTDLAQAVWDAMMLDWDANLREMGVGDLSVGKRIKVMGRAAQGRLRAYDEALKGEGDALTQNLSQALARNVYRARREPTSALVAYVIQLRDHLAKQSLASLMSAKAPFKELVRRGA
ncbi:MAG: ubiquinol-cytochrome C chaperone family protein [Pseudomonadota bacterium]